MAKQSADQPELAPDAPAAEAPPAPDPEQPAPPDPEPPVDPEPPSAAVARLPTPAGSIVTSRMRAAFVGGTADLIRATVARECNDAEFAMFLELAARYELDPFAKQIWAAKIGGVVQVFAAVEGLRAIANRHGDFGGVPSDVVREHDHFVKRTLPDGTPEVEHEYRDAQGTPTGIPSKRGAIVGAWAICYREGRKPTYFFATWEEYHGRNVWVSHPSAMMQKVPEGMALRKAYSITGVLSEGEFGSMERQAALNITAAPADPSYGEDPLLAARIRTLFDRLDYAPRKRLIKLTPLSSDEERWAFVRELEEEAEGQGIEIGPSDEENRLIDEAAAGEEVDAEAVTEAA